MGEAAGPAGLKPGSPPALVIFAVGLVIAVVVDVLIWRGQESRAIAAVFVVFSVAIVSLNFAMLVLGRRPRRRP